MSDARLAASLAMLGDALADARDPWWIIGSVAVKLHGGDPGAIADVDVIVSVRDLETLYARLPLTDTREEGKPQFVSQSFGRWAEPALAVEFMAEFSMLEEGEWRAVEPQTRQEIAVGERSLFVPERHELIALLHRFGRQKDLARAATL